MVAMIVAAGPLGAAVLLSESFDYTNGPLVTVSAGKWVTHSGTIGQLDVISGRADLQVPETEDVNASLAGQPYPATTNVVLYASFIANYTSLPSPGGQYFAHFKDTTTSNFRAKISGLTSGAGAGAFRLAIANGASTPVATNSTDLNLSTDYRIFIRYVISNATTTLWVNPVSEGSPSVTATDAATARAVTSFALRQDTGIGVLELDDLRVGTSFAEVYAPPPLMPPTITQQPASVAVVAGGTAVFSVAATGSAPLTYQSNFGGTSLSAATNSSFILNNAALADAGQYSVTVSNAAGSTNSATATLTVVEPSTNGTLTLVTYNVKGNFASDWSTNAAQVQAIARELQYLNPDIITLNEIPNGLRYEMTNWMIAFFPGRSLAVSSNTDGAIRSGFISRYPITRSQSWLDNASLTNFGYNGTYTRDLFEAEITVTGATEALQVFTTHLKSDPNADSQDRRAAECSAVSNFFATIFIPSNGYRPYVLTGDLNEDIAIPMSHSNQPIQRLVSAPTRLHLTTPVNPFTLSRFTHSIQGSNSLDARFDYITPAGVPSSNILNSHE